MKNQIKKAKNIQGITLIALVITIIILLILAAVTVLTLTGENGILKQSSTAKEETNEKEATEIMNLKITNAQIQSYTEKQEMPDLQYLANRLCEDNDMDYVDLVSQRKKIASNSHLPFIQVPEGGCIFTKLKEYPYEFKINSSLQLAAIDEVEIETSKDDTIAISKISEALNNIGIETSEDETLSSLAEKIENIKIPHITKLDIQGTGFTYSNIYQFNITSYENYKNLTLDNLSIQLTTTPFRATQQSDACGALRYTFSYNAENGIITVSLSGTMNHESWYYPFPHAIITIID